MKLPVWRIEDPDPAIPAPGAAPALVSLHFLRVALRRARRVWIGLGVLGLLAGIAWAVFVPPGAAGSVTIYLEHPPGSDPASAIATDVSMLRTRAVAQIAIDDLDLSLTPEQFQASVDLIPETNSVLRLTVAGPDPERAVERARVLAEDFLAFRSAQLRAHADALVAGYEAQVNDLRLEGDRITRQYDALVGRAASQGAATELLTQRAQVQTEISRIGQVIEDTSLQAESVIAATQVLDPAHAVSLSGLRRTVLAAGSGLIGGLACGIGLVLLLAMTSDRVRRREDVAEVLELPVGLSTGPLKRRRWLRLVPRRTQPQHNLDAVVQRLDNVIRPRKGHPARLVLVSTGNVDEATRVVASLGHRLAGFGMRVCLVDLSSKGRLQREFNRTRPSEAGPRLAVVPTVIRPDGVPALARGPRGLRAGQRCSLDGDEEGRTAWETAEVVLVLAEVDPGLGVANLGTWASRLVLLVTAGRSTVEQLRTTASLVRASHSISKEFVVLIGCDRSDDSLGEVPAAAPVADVRRARTS